MLAVCSHGGQSFQGALGACPSGLLLAAIWGMGRRKRSRKSRSRVGSSSSSSLWWWMCHSSRNNSSNRNSISNNSSHRMFSSCRSSSKPLSSQQGGEDRHGRLCCSLAQPQAGTAVDASAEPPAEQDAGRVGASVLAGPPPATTLVLPLSPEAAVGQHVSVWCIADEATGAGGMCRGTLLSWHPRKRQHSVQYEGKRQRQYCRLQEQTVEWRQLQGSPVTGPGSCWPGPEQDVAEKPPPPPPPQQQSQQPEPGESELQPSAQQGRRSVRLRRSTAKGAADDDEYG